jgi:hypothetical protein
MQAEEERREKHELAESRKVKISFDFGGRKVRGKYLIIYSHAYNSAYNPPYN